jgi:hypothetical protein
LLRDAAAYSGHFSWRQARALISAKLDNARFNGRKYGVPDNQTMNDS